MKQTMFKPGQLVTINSHVYQVRRPILFGNVCTLCSLKRNCLLNGVIKWCNQLSTSVRMTTSDYFRLIK